MPLPRALTDILGLGTDWDGAKLGVISRKFGLSEVVPFDTPLLNGESKAALWWRWRVNEKRGLQASLLIPMGLQPMWQLRMKLFFQ